METTAYQEIPMEQITTERVEPTVTAAPKPATAHSMFDQIIMLMADMIAKQITPKLERMVEDKITDAVAKRVDEYLDEHDFNERIESQISHYFRYRFELSDFADISELVSDAVGDIDISDQIDIESAVSNAISNMDLADEIDLDFKINEILSNKISEIRFEVSASL